MPRVAGTRVWVDDIELLKMFRKRESRAEQLGFDERAKRWSDLFQPKRLSVAEMAKAALARAREEKRRNSQIDARRGSTVAWSAGGTTNSQRRTSGTMGHRDSVYVAEPYESPLRCVTRVSLTRRPAPSMARC